VNIPSVVPIATRLTPGACLKEAIFEVVHQNKIDAGSITSCVGSLSTLNIRLAGAQETLSLSEPLEIVSLMGTLCPEHLHIHISVAKRSGEVVGGHLLGNSVIDTTAELVVLSYPAFRFTREFDNKTGFTELVVTKTGSSL
jgi:predicted DNA-binding protein with PD1-like motif